jgi:hypothetical protein
MNFAVRFSPILVTLFLACTLAAQTAKPASPAKAPTLEPGEISGGIYRNPFFGFSYKLPYGWADRTKAMNEGSDDSAPQSVLPSKSMVLLAVFERPPEATGDTINSGVVIAVDSSYPGLKSAVDYFSPIIELTTAKGFKVVNEPYQFPVDGESVVRGDFSKERGRLTMFQSSLVILQKGYAVSFTFIAGNDDDVNELVEGLSFAKKQRPRTGK